VDIRDSWWTKLWRAECHLKYVNREMRRYSGRNPYRVVRVVREADDERNVWQYNLVVTDRPDPMLSAMIGDCVHDIRCALDHVVTAHVPPKFSRASNFPIRLKDPWEKNADGGFVYPDKERAGFDGAIEGLGERATALIKALQPYASHFDPMLDHLAIVNELDNSDKHRQITTLLEGIEGVSTRVLLRGVDITDDLRRNNSILDTDGMVAPGTPVTRFRLLDPTIMEPDVDVKVEGTAKVVIRAEKFERNFETLETLRSIINYVGDNVLIPLLQAVKEDAVP